MNLSRGKCKEIRSSHPNFCIKNFFFRVNVVSKPVMQCDLLLCSDITCFVSRTGKAFRLMCTLCFCDEKFLSIRQNEFMSKHHAFLAFSVFLWISDLLKNIISFLLCSLFSPLLAEQIETSTIPNFYLVICSIP